MVVMVINEATGSDEPTSFPFTIHNLPFTRV